MAEQKQESDTFYQIVGFHFRVTFQGLPNAKKEDIHFQSVSGLDVQIETQPLKEGGENRFEHALPGKRKFSSTLTLKRGILRPGESGITDWCLEAFNKLNVIPLKTVLVELLGEDHQPLMKWDLAHVWPKSWKIGELNAERGEVLIETLELHYNRFELKRR